jgi:hypothetical protein
MSTAGRPRRRWLQFSIRTLLLTTSVVGVCLGLVVSRAHRERQIVEAIKQRGGRAFGSIAYSMWRPKWLYALLGNQFAPREHWTLVLNGRSGASHYDAQPCAAGDDTLALAAELRNISSLSLAETMVTDHGLRQLRGVGGLEELRLGRTNVGDRGLENLGGMTSLRSLGLAGTRVTDVGMLWVRSLPHLEHLGLADTQVTDEGLRHITGLMGLSSLQLAGTRIGDRGLEHLTRLRRLNSLILDDTRVTDAGMHDLGGLRELRSLWLRRTAVSDAGLREIVGLKLKILGLSETQVTGRGLEGVAFHENAEVCLDGCPVDDEGLRTITRARGVIGLHLSDTKITDSGLQWLTELGDEGWVILHGTSITDKGLKALSGRKGQLTIHAGGTAVTAAGAVEFMAACPACTVCVNDCKARCASLPANAERARRPRLEVLPARGRRDKRRHERQGKKCVG